MADVTMSDRDVQDLGAYRYLAPTPGEMAKKVKDLEDDAAKYREKIKGLEEKAKGVPAEGAVVLTGEDAAEYTAFKALGIKAADVEKLKGDNATLAADKRSRDRKDLLRAAREVEGWNEQAPDVLQNTTGFDALELTEGEVTVEVVSAGKKENVKKKTAFATVDGKPVRVSELVKDRWAYLAPVLSAGTTDGDGGREGRTVPDQRGGGGADAKVTGGIDALIEANRKAAEAPTPLRPAKV